MEDIIQGITTVGFPIIAYLLLYLDLRKLISKNTDALKVLINKVK